MTTTRRPKPLDLRPISQIVRRYARAATPMGTFRMSEGYELIRTCFADTVTLQYHPECHGSSMWAEVTEAGAQRAEAFLVTARRELTAAGYTVEAGDRPYTLKVKVAR